MTNTAARGQSALLDACASQLCESARVMQSVCEVLSAINCSDECYANLKDEKFVSPYEVGIMLAEMGQRILDVREAICAAHGLPITRGDSEGCVLPMDGVSSDR